MGLGAQTYRPGLAPPETGAAAVSPNPNVRVTPSRPGEPGADEVRVNGNTQEHDGDWFYLRGSVNVQTSETELWADEVDYNEKTGEVDARGNVRFEYYTRGEKLNCDRAQYNVNDETGTFWNVSGSASTRVQTRPGLLTTTTPFYFQASWAERLQEKYVLHEGFITDCPIPHPWWRLSANEIDVVPGDKAVAHKAWFYIRTIPLFYFPKFPKSLQKEPRQSGLLTPSIGHSSQRGFMGGAGFFWAINRSYDVTYRAQYFSKVGLSHLAEFRGAVSDNTSFGVTVSALQDTSSVPSISAGGYSLVANFRSILGHGWEAHVYLDLLSSLAYRQEFSLTLAEAIQSETHSVGYLSKHWNDFSVNLVGQRDIDFQDPTPGNHVQIRKLPEAEISESEHQVRDWPLWFSFGASDGLEDRTEPGYQNGQVVEPSYETRAFDNRADMNPMLTTAFHWAGFSVMPSVGLRETFYANSLRNGQITGDNLVRNSRDVTVDVLLPPLERIFKAPSWMGDKVKHVIEPRITYKYVTGIDNFNRIIRFDQADLASNTNQVEFSLTNRLLAKDKGGNVSDALIWQLYYERYFDPTFGGAVTPAQRNTVEAIAELTGYTFLDGYRRQSPIVSSLRYQSRVSFEWRTDYDLVRRGFVDSNISMYGKISNYTFTAGESFVKTDPVLAPNANQVRGAVTYGNANRRGWNVGVSGFYDYREGTLAYLSAQATYNTDCCGFSAQWRRLKFGLVDDNYYVFSLAISNIGTFGSLRRQDRTF